MLLVSQSTKLLTYKSWYVNCSSTSRHCFCNRSHCTITSTSI